MFSRQNISLFFLLLPFLWMLFISVTPEIEWQSLVALMTGIATGIEISERFFSNAPAPKPNSRDIPF